jgi:hypothetical protein
MRLAIFCEAPQFDLRRSFDETMERWFSTILRVD